jgi:2-polyprenyl-3-methyl-5-hydroxy-6-metoxy-1,4-benzoquinol methylase
MSVSPNQIHLEHDVETASDGYVRRFQGSVGKYFLDVQEESIKSLLKKCDLNEAEILELGASHGQLAELLFQYSKKTTLQFSSPELTLRISPEMLTSVATILHPLSKLSAKNISKEKSFDLVVAIRLMAHVEPWEQFVQTLCEFSKEYVLIDCAPKSSWNLLTPIFFFLKKGVEKSTRSYNLQWISDIKRAFQKNGFEVIGEKRQFFFPMGAHRALKSRALSETIECLPRVFGLTALFGGPVVLLARKIQNPLTL